MLEECAEWQENDDDDDGDLFLGEKGTSYKRTVGLIFAGDGVEAASVILPRNIKNASKVTKELLKLKECKNLGDLGSPNSNSCAFMFACCGRGKHFHNDKSNVESKCFKDIFPNTPLIGIFGEGEFGWNYLPTDKNSTRKSDGSFLDRSFLDATRLKELKEDLCHSYTTVFVVLSFNTGSVESDAQTAANIIKIVQDSMSSS